jgi:hypothetical protein
MGMFDNVTCEYPLPMPEDLGELTQEQIQNTNYQTKNLANGLDRYKIDKDGFLWREKVDGYHEEGDPKAKSMMDRLGRFVETSRTWRKEPITCTVDFYEFFTEQDSNDYWVEYQASFTDGKLNQISLIEFEKEDNAERKARAEKWEKQLKDRNEFLNKWYIKYWYAPWRYIVRMAFRTYRKIKRHIPSDWQVENFLLPW